MATTVDQAVLQILVAMCERPAAKHYVADLTVATGLGFATAYAALARLEREEVVTGCWDPPVRPDGPRRRHYHLPDLALECLP